MRVYWRPNQLDLEPFRFNRTAPTHEPGLRARLTARLDGMSARLHVSDISWAHPSVENVQRALFERLYELGLR